MRWPLVWRSTLDDVQVRLSGFADLAANQSTILKAFEEDCDRLRSRVEDYKRTCATRDEIIAGNDAALDHYAGRVLEFESTIADKDLLISANTATVIQHRRTIDELKTSVATLRVNLAGHAAAIEALEDNQTALRDECAEWHAKYVDVSAKLATLTKQPETKPSAIDAVIREQARQPDGTLDMRLVRHFRDRAAKLRRQNKSDDEIITTLETWSTTEGTDAMTVEKIVESFGE